MLEERQNFKMVDNRFVTMTQTKKMRSICRVESQGIYMEYKKVEVGQRDYVEGVVNRIGLGSVVSFRSRVNVVNLDMSYPNNRHNVSIVN